MALRLLEVIIPQSSVEEMQEILKNENLLDLWREEKFKEINVYKLVTRSEDAESIMDKFEKRFSALSEFRIVLLPVEATVPRPSFEKEQAKDANVAPEEKKRKRLRVSREELYDKLVDSAQLNYVYVAMISLATVVAAIGLIQSNIVIVIGAMVIAPLLGPSVALSLATTLGDPDLGRRSLKTNVVGILLAFVIAVAMGMIFRVDAPTRELASRTAIAPFDIIVALAAGSAGALAFTSGISTILIGVMVAVSLLPPLAACGVLIGNGFVSLGAKSFLLFLANFISINLAGVLTFTLQGIRPLNWWEEKKAKSMTRFALFLWLVLLALLLTVIYLIKA
ncbi:MAG: TIGR00341 family protein [Candidatus Latescibacteria bacterium 4484_7]|nr:MAG: TIGR00341 family protein [Candidatus Latescibacteria bacterium 4484_7]